MAYRFNDNAGRFIDERGRFVSETTVRAVIDEIADGASARLGSLAQELVDQTRSLAEWQASSMAIIKDAHLSTAAIGNGGWAQMTAGDYGAAGRAIRDQYAYHRAFASGISAGAVPPGPGLIARARQYGQAARTTFENTYRREQERRGFRAVKNQLGKAEHCLECPEITRRGWMPISEMKPIGSRRCGVNDRCSLVYSRDARMAI